jgi:hypothetical protein
LYYNNSKNSIINMTREKLSCYFKIISNVTTIKIHFCYYSNPKIIYFNHKRSNNHNYLF